MNELNKIYVAILRTWATEPRDNAALVMTIDNVDYPIKLGDDQVYLPMDEMLEKNTTGKVFFHPACEVITSGETEIFKIIRNISGITLLTSFTKYLTVLVNIAKKKSKKSMRNDLLEMLEPFREVTDVQIKELGELFRKMTVKLDDNSHLDNRFIYFKTTKGGRTADNERIYYKAVPQFPFYNEINRKLNRSESSSPDAILDVSGVKLSKRSLALAVHLFRMVFPGIVNADAYEYNSLRAEAARFVAYAGSFALVADDMNKIQNNFRDEFDKAGVYCIDTSWIDNLDNIPEWTRMIPVLDYNNHSIKPDNVQPAATTGYNINDMMTTTVSQPHVTTHQNVQNAPQPMNMGEQITQVNGQEYVITRPSVIPPEYTYNGYRIDPYSNSVIHSATNPLTGQVSEYTCTRKGNFLMSTSNAGMTGMMNNGMMMMNGGVMQQHMLMGGQPAPQIVMMTPQQVQQQQQPQIIYATAPAAAPVATTQNFVTY